METGLKHSRALKKTIIHMLKIIFKKRTSNNNNNQMLSPVDLDC